MKTGASTYWTELASGKRTSTKDQLFILLLAPLGKIYSLVQSVRVLLYRFGILKSRQLPRPVVSIGNITVGGTGKTPVTAYIARELIKRGYRPAVLSRGYGGSLEGECLVVSDGNTVMLSPEECGDEPYLLASTVKGLMLVIGSDRYAAGCLAMKQLSPDIFLLDDGFQHLKLFRDINILLLDHSRPLGNGWTLPAGSLREPAKAAERADAILFTRCPEGTAVSPSTSEKPIFAASHRIIDATPLKGGEPVAIDSLKELKLMAFAGIANPQHFFSSLIDKGLNLVATVSLPDHVRYARENIEELNTVLRKSGADYAITTEKDGVKLRKSENEISEVTYMARLDVEIKKSSDLMKLVFNLLP
ncbi:MAG: tetraacyldisaccharide 4'-kinase [Desulfuromonadaceae bacterium]|nr:tetraacyldisaccharide 4'-kinase [Desulfuromonadaceae bacterium]MDD2854377.1 tetraacyldisaccharide 4'-kinase [Desulfuromonadaceae bacterium]